jgi:hypothetical protein
MTIPNIHDIPTVPTDDQEGDGLPRFYWTNGDFKAQRPGFFRIAQTVFDVPPPDPWKAETIRFENGGSEDDYTTDKIRLAIIASRQQAFSRERDANGKEQRMYLPTKFMEKGASNQSVLTEVLCLIEGLEGLYVWSAPSIKTSMAIVGNGGILSAVRDLQTEAARMWKVRVNRWAFWLPIKATLDKEGVVIFEKTKGKPVTPPRAYIPKKDPLNLYVGDDLYRYGYEIWQQYAEWSKQRRGGAVATADEPDEPPAVRNVPQPLADSELEPF